MDGLNLCFELGLILLQIQETVFLVVAIVVLRRRRSCVVILICTSNNYPKFIPQILVNRCTLLHVDIYNFILPWDYASTALSNFIIIFISGLDLKFITLIIVNWSLLF